MKELIANRLEDFGQGGDALAAICFAEPGPGVQFFQFCQREICAGGPCPSVVRSSGGVVVDDHLTVLGQFDVEFNGICAVFEGQLEGRQGVFRRVGRCAAMSKDGGAG
jgi:hypothetical protein